ncbi:hypothetical protein DAY19_10630 [Halobacteriovorax vibrionivorans]|uniref:Tetratricopeptide repeat protein n=1 Tax=Halobacteriovorax vibrionivorans TaxID=2152716 RepID=A0ABY0II21_9BACT|nr:MULTISPECIES: hypothetical protein [Halobacteriovorax]RZF22129.1 hypothetical protein DAY19_10630 [Halobacteriovorax vibrionivorans]TGD47171.1 hypothetical protein EP118_09185 [Halobacteriovorax sp. Y22]
MLKKSIIAFLLMGQVFALESIWTDLTKSRNRIARYPHIIKLLIEKEMYHTAVPYVKEYLVTYKGRTNKDFERLFEKVVSKVGDRQFVLLPEQYLSKIDSPTLKYLLAKKLLKRRKYKEALQTLNGTIPAGHPVKAFSLHLEGMAFTMQRGFRAAISAFERCVDMSTSSDDEVRARQLQINHDYCLAGIARVKYEQKKLDDAELSFIDVDKRSYIWPELLIEEAWNSYYKGDYNRTLGKLVTYKAPVLNYIVNPEINVLKALSYFKLCLYDDMSKIIDDHYAEFDKSKQVIDKMIARKHSLEWYFNFINSFVDGKKYYDPLTNKVLRNVSKDPAFIQLFQSYKAGLREISNIKKVRNRRLRKILAINLKDSLMLQQKLIGSYTKRTFKLVSAQLEKSFIGLSYLRLEALNARKAKLYSGITDTGARGDIKYLKRNSKQYFWSFNGEFWADEMGDYVFALRSECQ